MFIYLNSFWSVINKINTEEGNNIFIFIGFFHYRKSYFYNANNIQYNCIIYFYTNNIFHFE